MDKGQKKYTNHEEKLLFSVLEEIAPESEKATYEELSIRMDQAHESFQQRIKKADQLLQQEVSQIYQETGWTEEEYKAQQQKFIDEFFSKWYRKGK